MNLYFWRSTSGNFGDDLNEWLWPRIFPDFWDPDDDVTFLGVGSIINDGVPETSHRIVFGSGVGIGRLPDDFKDSSWKYYCVRGPLSAKVLQIPENAAITDSAILLRTFPEFIIKENKGVVFVPHWTTAELGHWQKCCRLAGVEFLDPRDESRSVIRRIAGAELVLAESMHAAIVADAFRVPWQPLISENHVVPFKWQDWCLSLGMYYKPNIMPKMGLFYRVKDFCERNLILSKFYSRLFPEIYKDKIKLESQLNYEVDNLIEIFFEKQRRLSEEKNEAESKKKFFTKKRTKILIKNIIDNDVFSFLDEKAKENAARELEKLSKRTSHLSSDSALNRATERLLDKVEQLKIDYINGFRAPSCQ